MGTLTLRLDVDPVTKKKSVWVKLESDADALPIEHEEQHRKIVEALLKGGIIKADELDTIHIEREGQGVVIKSEEGPISEREGVKNKG